MRWTGLLLTLFLALASQVFAGQIQQGDEISPATTLAATTGSAYHYSAAGEQSQPLILEIGTTAGTAECTSPYLAAAGEGDEYLAQVQFGRYCCDLFGSRRCMLPVPGPVGIACYCNGIPGTGYVCW